MAMGMGTGTPRAAVLGAGAHILASAAPPFPASHPWPQITGQFKTCGRSVVLSPNLLSPGAGGLGLLSGFLCGDIEVQADPATPGESELTLSGEDTPDFGLLRRRC